MAGGVEARPYVVSLSVDNGGLTTPVIRGGTPSSGSASSGQVTAVVAPQNLCRIGDSPAHGNCYSTPNRVGLTVGYSSGQVDGYNFAAPSVPVSPTIDANSTIDMTIALNTLGRTLRWSWVNGTLLYWHTTNLGQADALVHIRFKPAIAPYVAQFPQNNGCTASPIMNCEIPSADGEVLTASMVMSLDDTLDPSLTGAVFATQNAIYGYLQPAGSGGGPASGGGPGRGGPGGGGPGGGGPAAQPSLGIQMASSHLTSTGGSQVGSLQAFIPAAALLHFFGMLPGDAAAALGTTRAGDAGSNAAPTYTTWTTAANGSDGVLVTVNGITFSVPDYKLTSRLKYLVAHARMRRGKTAVTAVVARCSKRQKCLASLYDLGGRSAKQFNAARRTVASDKIVTGSALTIVSSASRLKRGHRFLLVVHLAKSRKLLASAIGVVS
jgi:hypothetical protein